MIDDHFIPSGHWGIKPVLFNIGSFGVPSYSFFVILGLIVGLAVYFYEAKKTKNLNDNGFLIVVGALTGGAIGAKLLELIINYNYFLSNVNNVGALLSGRTIVGGLIGGTIGAVVTKKILGIKEKRGNLFAPAIALGVAIGRFGCFFRGCCYGKPTSLPWGVDFGDHVLRYPTQLFEALFMLIMFLYLERIKNRKDIKPGQLFKILMLSYFTFRFFIEFIRVEPQVFAGLTVFQIISVGVIVYLLRDNIKNNFNRVKKRYASRKAK